MAGVEADDGVTALDAEAPEDADDGAEVEGDGDVAIVRYSTVKSEQPPAATASYRHPAPPAFAENHARDSHSPAYRINTLYAFGSPGDPARTIACAVESLGGEADALT